MKTALIKSRLIHYGLLIIILCLILNTPLQTKGQERKPFQLPSTQVGVFKVNYFFNTQLVARYQEMNKGTLVGADEVGRSFDVSVRRTRINANSQMGKVYWKVQVGFNNLNQTRNRSELRVLDAYAKWTPADYFHIGGGKSIYYGLSRYSSLSTSSMITAEIPLTALTTINKDDDLIRRNNVFAEGQIGKFDYNIILAKPFLSTTAGAPVLSEPKLAPDFYPTDAYQTSGYFVYRFKDNEGMGAVAPGSYLGKKKLINVGVGFMYQSNATWIKNAAGDTLKYAMLHWAADFMLDMPLDAENDKSFTFYALFMDANYGPNYVRNVGVNSIATGTTKDNTYNGAGNAYPGLGSGIMTYAQTAYRWRAKSWESVDAWMPYAAINISDYEGLDELVAVYEYGLNVLFYGHESKLTLGFQHRPIFETNANGKIKSTGYKPLALLQYSIRLKS